MMDKVQVFTVRAVQIVVLIDFDTNVFVWGWGRDMLLPLSMQNVALTLVTMSC
jgi:hypothetical protein